MSVPGDPGLEAGLKAVKHDLETATTEAENLNKALGKLLQAAYEASGEKMPDLDLQDTAGEAYRYTLNLLEAGRGGAAAGEQDREAGASQSEVSTDTAEDSPLAGAVRAAYGDAGQECPDLETPEGAEEVRRFLAARAASPAGQEAEVPAGTAPDEDTAARQRDQLLDAVHEAVRGGPPAAEDREAYNFEEALAELKKAATDLAGLRDRDAGASQEAEVPEAGAASALAGAVRAAYAAYGEAPPPLETGDDRDAARDFLVERMKKLADIQTARAPGAAADGEFIRLIYDVSGEKMPNLETPGGYALAHSEALAELKASVHRRPEEDAVSTDTAAPAAAGGGGENHPSLGGIDPSLGGIIRLIYDVSGKEMPDLATEDGAAKATQFLAGRQAVLAGEVKEIEKAFEHRSSNAQKAADGLRETARAAKKSLKALAGPIEAAFDNAGIPHKDLATPEGVEAVGKFFEALRLRGAAAAEAAGPQAAMSTGTAADSPLAGAVRAAYGDAGQECPDLETPEGAEEVRRFLAARAASPAGQEAEVPAGTAPDEVTAAWQRNRLLDAVHEAVRGGPPRTAEDREAYNFEEATKDLKEAGLQDRDAGASQSEVSTDTAADSPLAGAGPRWRRRRAGVPGPRDPGGRRRGTPVPRGAGGQPRRAGSRRAGGRGAGGRRGVGRGHSGEAKGPAPRRGPRGRARRAARRRRPRGLQRRRGRHGSRRPPGPRRPGRGRERGGRPRGTARPGPGGS